jgi:hypothetical protein
VGLRTLDFPPREHLPGPPYLNSRADLEKARFSIFYSINNT